MLERFGAVQGFKYWSAVATYNRVKILERTNLNLKQFRPQALTPKT